MAAAVAPPVPASTLPEDYPFDEYYFSKPGGKFGVLEKSKEVAGIQGDFDSIPVIDISGIFSDKLEDRQQVAEKLRDACTRIGFFYIKNHGVPQDLVEGCFDWAHKFFALPLEKKMEHFVNDSHNLRGYTPPDSGGRVDKEGKGSEFSIPLQRLSA